MAGFSIAANGGSLVKRIHRLLHQPKERSSAVLPVVAAAFVILACAVLVTAWPGHSIRAESATVVVSLPQPVRQLPVEPAPDPINPKRSLKSGSAVTSTPHEGQSEQAGGKSNEPAAGLSQENDGMASLRAKLTDLERQQTELAVTFGPGYPARQRIAQQITEIRRRISSLAGEPTVGTTQETDAVASLKARLAELESLRRQLIAQQVVEARPEISSLQEPGSVRVTGAVKMPGVYRVKGEKHLLDMLAMAQGFTPDAGEIILVTRTENGSSQSFLIQTKDLFGGRTDLNMPIVNGDAINVLFTAADLEIYVVGEVSSPGTFHVRKTITLAQAVALAGGLGPNGDASAVQIIRQKDNGTDRETLLNDFRLIERGLMHDVPLQQNDIVLVRPLITNVQPR
jgi:protein involved in polysaccharide export with SLBB domain